MKAHIRMTSDIAYMIPQTMPNVPPVEYISEGPLVGNAEYLNLPVCLDLQKLIAPAGLFIGKIRTGKSTSAKAVLARLRVLYGTNILIFDPHGEYSEMTRQLGGTVIDMVKNSINPCKLSGNLSNKQKAMQLTDMLNTVFQFSDVQFAVLLDYITRGYDRYGEGFTFELLVQMIKEDFGKKSRDSVTLGGILRRIEMLSGNIFGDKNSVPLGQVTSGIVCMDVSGLENNQLRNMSMLSVLQHIYNTMLASQGKQNDNSSQIRLIIMIDEAGRVASDSSSVAVKLVKESGKFKIGLFFGIQDIPDIDSKILSNYGFVFVHKLDNHEYISRIQQDCSFTQEQAARIRSLPVGTAFLKLNFKDASVQSPFTVKVLQVEFPQTCRESDTNSRNLTSFKQSEPEIQAFGKISEKNGSDKVDTLPQKTEEHLDDVHIILLKSISENPTFNVTEHYKNIKLDPYHGNEVRKFLEDKEYVKGRYLEGRYAKKGKILELTEKAIEEYGLANNTKRHGGVLHNYLVDKIAAKFSSYTTQKEFPIGGGKQVDLVIEGVVAVEVETKSFSESNIIKALEFGFPKVIVVCNPQSVEHFRKRLEEMQVEKSKVNIMTPREILTKNLGDGNELH